ncbi:hypothetical protein O181_057741 [Austropuccinia psidii MF-1]|uniref:Uncharacterized protein n=1 Tax=Austropuccinia psidii MF-1 TaxID=1389203 RepID=A0A9Q3E8W9_9BASI|nr:hypothetical protein [Austropuccinia psidii MF-1]
MGHYWRDLCLQLGGANAEQRMNNLVCMEVSGKLKTQKMNGRTEVPILARLVQVSNTSNNCLAREGCQCCPRKSLCLYKLPTIQTTPYACAGSRPLPRKSLHCAGSRQFESFLTPVLASNNSHTNPDSCAGSQQFKQFLTLRKASYHSHANPYACAGSNNAANFLRLCRLLTIHTRILMLVNVPNNSDNSIHH